MRKKNAENKLHPKPQHFDLQPISPLTKNQEIAFDAWDDGKNLFFHGWPGTGKSFCALYLALEELFNNKSLKRIIIVRSVVPGRDMGFLPGSIKEKIEIYEAPYKDICSELFHRDDAYDIMKQKGIIEFTSTSFLRSITWRDAIVIMDECQNFEYNEFFTSMTRLGENCRVILCGDGMQIDLNLYKVKSPLKAFINIIKSMESFTFIEMQKNDIVRSGLVKEFLIAYHDKFGREKIHDI